MRRLPKYLLFFFVIAVACCDRHTAAWGDLDRADAIMESAPDSALAILSEIDASALGSKEERARYALLMSMALDKNYIDTTTFDILQPAIDYYPKHGTPDERLRTYYYQGRIYQNQGEDGKAIALLHDAINLEGTATDTLTLARAYVSHGQMMYKLYKIDEYTQDNLKAARLFNSCKKNEQTLRAYQRAFSGSIFTFNIEKADSILHIIYNMQVLAQDKKLLIDKLQVQYNIAFGDSVSIRTAINKLDKTDLTLDDILLIVQGYTEINDIEMALEYLSLLDYIPYNDRTIRHLILSSEAKEKIGNYRDALTDFKAFNELEDSLHIQTIREELNFAEQRHLMEIEAVRVKEKIRLMMYLLIVSAVGSLLIITVLILYLRVIKLRRKDVEQKNHIIKAKLKQKSIEHEGLIARIALMEREYADLTELLNNKKNPEPVSNILRTRAEMINSLLVGYITERPKAETEFTEWAKKLIGDRIRFMNDTRKAIQALYPKFIDILDSKGLTIEEINYVCLYAIGMTGKEIGIYMEKPGHYNLSSIIRRKLGLEARDTNIGTYIRGILSQYETHNLFD